MVPFPSGPPQEVAKLQLNRQFKPCAAEPGDELYPNGIFEFNVTRLLAFVQAHTKRFPIELVELTDIPDYGGGDNLDEAAILACDLSRPILLAEIAPGHHNLIDGHHRLAKARRRGLRHVPAYRVRCPEHVGLLTSTRAYETYVEYRNSKVDPLPRYNRRARHGLLPLALIDGRGLHPVKASDTRTRRDPSVAPNSPSGFRQKYRESPS